MNKWDTCKFDEVIYDDTKRGIKIKKEDYLEEGQYPIIDQGQKLIAGYHNNKDGLYTDVPAIIFGDHTRIVKYIDTPFFLGADGVKILKTKREDVDYKFLYYYFLKNEVPDTGYNRHFKWLKKLNIPIPPHKTQKQIAKTLDTVSELLSLRKQQYIELDNLTKSIFYEMFGDPMINEKGFSKVLLGELCELITKGSSPNWQGIEYVNDDTQTLFITSENVREGFLDLSKKKYIHDGFNKIQQRSVLKKGDFLINIVGASIGRAARFDYDIKANINQAVALVRLKKNSINHTYLLAYLNSPKALSMYESMKVSAARANLSLENINNLEILLPPNELQENYEYIATKIEEQKTLVRKSIKETQLLFDSLMSQYFDE